PNVGLGGGGGELTLRVRRSVPPVLPLIKDNLPAVADELERIPAHLGDIWTYLFLTLRPYPVLYYWICGMLVLALLSAWCHRQKRKKLAGKALPLTAGAADDE